MTAYLRGSAGRRGQFLETTHPEPSCGSNIGGEVSEIDQRDFDVDVDAIRQRPRNALAVVFDLSNRTTAHARTNFPSNQKGADSIFGDTSMKLEKPYFPRDLATICK